MRFLKVLREPAIIDLGFVKAQEKPLAELCKKYGLDLLYVHGSLARNKMKKLSDVDVAVSQHSGKLGLDGYLDILAGLQEIFKREDIDLVDLKEAPALLKMRVLQSGKLLYHSDAKSLVRFRYKTITDYLATSFLRKSFSVYLRKAYGLA